MKRFLIFFAGLFLFAAAGFAAVVDKGTPFVEAAGKYKTADFKGADRIYKEVLKNGPGTAALYYNLGNTSFRLGKKGEARLYYERALEAAPRDPDIQWNLAILKNTLADHIQEKNISPVFLWLRQKAAAFTADETALFVSVILSLLVLCALAGLRYRGNRFIKGLGSLLCLALVAAATLGALKWNQVKDPRLVILQKEALARNGPSEKETKAFLLHEGAVAGVADETKDWFYITLESGDTGWILKNSGQLV